MATHPNRRETSTPSFDLSATVGQRVVRLPTAPRCKVQQNQNRAAVAAKAALRDQMPWKGDYVFPGIREAAKRVHSVEAIESSPARITALLIRDIPSKEARLIYSMIGHAAEAKHPLAEEVVSLFRGVTGETYGEQNDTANAIELMNEGRL
jgi:hypothetical protein